MLRLCSAGLLALLSLAVCTLPASSAVQVRLPFITIQVGKPAPVAVAQAPVQPQPAGTPLGVPVPVELPPGLVPVLPPPTPAPAVVHPIPHGVFASTFKPAPGTYAVVFLHPGSKCAVPVTFTLPPGCPKVEVRAREVVFDYGKREVEIRFKICGKVAVNYR